MPSVAFGPLVGLDDGDDDGATLEASILQEDCEVPGQLSCALPGPSGGPSHFRQEFNLSRAQHDLDEEDLDFLSNHLASGTASGYGYSFRKFRLFCEHFQADPLTCTPAIVVKYVKHLYEEGAKYSTVNGHRSAISKFHVGVHGIPMGEHPLVSQAVKAVFRLRPPLPQYRATFDIVPVLAYVRSLPTASIPLKLLSFKTLLLAIYASISRVSSMARLAPSLEETRDAVVLTLQSLEKQSREGRTRGYFQIPRFAEDTELCPVYSLSVYYSKVKGPVWRFL